MPRPLRFIPPGSLVEVSCRTLQAQFLLTPSPEVNAIIKGVLAVAQEKYGGELVEICVLSSHFHMLLLVQNAEQLADFMEYFQGNVARKLNRFLDRTGTFWHNRYHAIVVSDEEEAQIDRLRYLLENSCKENLVSSPLEWPGVHSAQAMIDGVPLEGTWISQGRVSAEQRRRRGEDVDPMEFARTLPVILAPLPAWAHLSPEDYQGRVATLVREIEEETAARHAAKETRPKGALAVMEQDPFYRPAQPKSSPMPLFHAFRQKVKKLLYAAYHEFVAAYRVAAEKLRLGFQPVDFPEGCFPPALPFVVAPAFAPAPG